MHAGLLALSAQHVLFDELVAWAAVQAELQVAIVLWKAQGVLWHADGEGQVAANAADDDGGADVAGLYSHLSAHPGAAALHYSQAATLATSACSILKGEGQILCGRLVHLLIRAAMIRLKDHGDLKKQKGTF